LLHEQHEQKPGNINKIRSLNGTIFTDKIEQGEMQIALKLWIHQGFFSQQR